MESALNWAGTIRPEKKWVFILGCYNSGTTLLQNILGHHPAIADMGDEGVMLTDSLPRPEDFGWRRMWLMCEPEMQIPMSASERIASRCKRHWSLFQRKSAPLLLEKSISNVPRLDFLAANFSPAFFIHLVRDGYSVAEGIRRKAKPLPGNPFFRKRYPVELCSRQWRRTLEIIEQHRQKMPNFLELKYEFLTAQPTAAIEQICQFLAIENLPATCLMKVFQVHEKSLPISNLNASSFARLSAADQDAIAREAGSWLDHFGYERPGE